MTFQDYDTYNWYLEDIPRHLRQMIDPSELPDKVEEAKFWQSRDVFYAVGRVQIMNGFE